MKVTPRNRIIERQQYDDLMKHTKKLTGYMIDTGDPLVQDQIKIAIFHIRPILKRMFEVNPHSKEVKIRDIEETEYHLLRHYLDVIYTMAHHYHMPDGLITNAKWYYKSTVVWNYR